jgi:ribosomal protein L29
MKKRELQELRSKPVSELTTFVREGRERLRGLKFDLAAGKVKDVKELHSLKKEIARALMLIHLAETPEKAKNNQS